MDLPQRMLPLVSVGVAELHPGGTTALGCAVGSRVEDPQRGEVGDGFL